MLFQCRKIPKSYDSTIKIGKLPIKERFQKIKKYKRKKAQRVWKRDIEY